MKKALFTVFCLLAVAAFASAATETKGIKPHDVSGKPDVFCKVTKEPDPSLLGGWKCSHRRYNMKLHKYVTEHIEFWLVKYQDRYGLYLFREKPGEKTYRGWREYTINGNQITSRTGIKFFTRGEAVYYSWEGGDPTEMTRIEGN